MKKKKYEAPLTEYTQVELESGFMQASIIENEDDSEVTSGNQEIQGSHDFTDRDDVWN